mmetsp:Transcript_930/g.3695  ORF Transcript_930/g.3695 Transcript_930/m.3695 type:complete len:237 (+) Transcript_930:68-778(+)
MKEDPLSSRFGWPTSAENAWEVPLPRVRGHPISAGTAASATTRVPSMRTAAILASSPGAPIISVRRESSKMRSASAARLRIGLPRTLKEVLMRTAQPVRALTARRSALRKASPEEEEAPSPPTIWGRAVPSKCRIAGSASAAAAVRRGALDMYGEGVHESKTRSASSAATIGATGRHHSRNLRRLSRSRVATVCAHARSERWPSARGPNSARPRATPTIAPSASRSATAAMRRSSS